jgi:hypothetical protein
MDTITQALASFNNAISGSSSAIATAAQAAVGVEQLASQAVAATGTAPTNAQKLQAGVAIASALDPQIGTTVANVGTLISAVVGVFNLFGIFNHGAPAAAAAPAPVTVPPVPNTVTPTVGTLNPLPSAPAA